MPAILCWPIGVGLAVALLSAALPCCGQEGSADWGTVWQSQLPELERHPSLFYDEADRPRMLERIGHEPWKSWWERRSSYLHVTALRWWLLGDANDAQKARASLLDQPIWRQTPQGYLEPSSHRFADYVIAYDLLAGWGGLSTADHTAIRSKIAAEADHYYSVLEGGAVGGANYGNQRTLAASALGMAALALCEYAEGQSGPAEWLATALREIRRDENWWFFRPDGLFVEGLGYTGYMSCQFVPFSVAYERATGKYLFSDERLRQWLVFSCYQVLGNGDFTMWGTCESSTGGLSYLAPLCNARYGKDLAPLFQRAFNLRPGAAPHPLHMHLALAHYDHEVAGAVPPASSVFPLSQMVVLRESWQPEAASVWFSGKDGTWPLAQRYGTYSHADCGSFVLAFGNETLATDSGYDHWQSRDYYGGEFHNVLLVDGKGPAQETPGELSEVGLEGPVRHAKVTTQYGGCRLRRTLALVRGRYVLVADCIGAQGKHEYTWQVRSTCPPGAEGSSVSAREVTWPGLSAEGWRDLRPGRARLTTVAPPFASLRVDPGRWRPISGKPEFANQVAKASWRAADSTALFALLPNDAGSPELSWGPLDGQGLEVRGGGWQDRVTIDGGELRIGGSDGLQWEASL